MRREAPSDLPEPDRIEGAPHPRDTRRLFGQAAAEAAFLAAHEAGRLHHAWLLTGPQGIGKATLAWRIAAFLLAEPQPGGLFAAPLATLDVAGDDPVRHRLRALSEPRLALLRRGPNDKGTALSQVIAVDEVREMKKRFLMTAVDGGRRVAIVDAADEMNPQAANALLKLLEEPPDRVVFLLVAHRPARLLPTIRSRCRTLALAPLGPADLSAALAQAGIAVEDATAMAELAQGSAGTAVRLALDGGMKLYADLVALAAGLPRIDRGRAIALADSLSGKAAEGRFELLTSLLDRLLARLARRGTTGIAPPPAAAGEAAVLARLAPGPAAGRAWADLAQSLTERGRRGRALNLDASALALDMLFRIDDTAARTAAMKAVS
jgi:DNA polymerase III subunit delta'